MPIEHVNLQPFKIQNGKLDYPVKHNAAMDGQQTTINQMVDAVNGAVETVSVNAENIGAVADNEDNINEVASNMGLVEKSAQVIGLDAVFSDTASGLSATTEGDYFSVPSADVNEYLILYMHDSGSVATPIRRYPSTEIVASLADAVRPDEETEDAVTWEDRFGAAAGRIKSDGTLEFKTGQFASIEADSVETESIPIEEGEEEDLIRIDDKYGAACFRVTSSGEVEIAGAGVAISKPGGADAGIVKEVRFSGSGVDVASRSYGAEVIISGGGSSGSLGKLASGFCGRSKIVDPETWIDKTLIMEAGTELAPSSLFWPSVIRTDRIPDASARYYMYFSTDHGVETGSNGIHLATAESPLGPWTAQGRIYTDGSLSSPCETPCVVWDRYENKYRMFYHRNNARYGPENDLVPMGQQSTLSATSADGLTWTKDPYFVIEHDGLTSGDGHTGYFNVHDTPDGYIATSLYGGTSASQTITWCCSGPIGGMLTNGVINNNWYSDRRSRGRGYELTEKTTSKGLRAAPQTLYGYTVNGTRYAIGAISENRSGILPGDARICVGPITQDYRRFVEYPEIIWEPTEAWESADIRGQVASFVDDDYVYIFYTMAVEQTERADTMGVIRHAI